MNTLGIVQVPNPVLREECLPVEDFDAFQELADRLYGAAKADGRKGVAAPQIGVAVRAFAVTLGESPYPRVLCNAEITNWYGEQTDREGCLSVAERWFDIKRALTVNVTAYDKKGKKVELVASGWDARALQHEIDHLSGILVIDRAKEQMVNLPRQQRRAVERTLAKVPA